MAVLPLNNTEKKNSIILNFKSINCTADISFKSKQAAATWIRRRERESESEMTMFKKTVLWQQVFNDRGLTLAQLLLKYYKSFGPILFFFYFNVEVTILIKIFSQKCVIFYNTISIFLKFLLSYILRTRNSRVG